MHLVLGVLALVVGLLGLAFTVVRVIRLARPTELVRVPLASEQTVVFAEPGPMVLQVEGPHLTTDFAGLQYGMADSFGRAVPLRPVAFRTHTSTLAHARLSLHRLQIEAAGSYRLRIDGLGDDPNEASAIVFTRPLSGGLPLAIVGIVVAGALTIGGIVLTAMALTAPSAQTVAAGALPEVPASAGRQIRSDRSAASTWRAVHWPAARMTFEVPADWVERANDAHRLELHAANAPAIFLTLRRSPAPDLTPEAFLKVSSLQASGRLGSSRIAGYAVRTFGGAAGVLSFENSKDSTREQLTWTGLEPRGQYMITCNIGAPADQFPRIEPVLGAILDSLDIE